MQEIEKTLRSRCAELLESGACDRVLAWEEGEFFYDKTPAVFTAPEKAEKLCYDSFCGANLSKYLIEKSAEGKPACCSSLAIPIPSTSCLPSTA